MSEVSTHDCKEAFGEEMQKQFEAMPHPDYKCRVIEDGEIIDLGGRQIKCISIPAHHPGSMAFLDYNERQIFTGDELDAGQAMLMEPDPKAQVQQHLANMEKLKAEAAHFDIINPAHNGTHLVARYLDDYIAVDKGYLDGSLKPLDSIAGFGCGEGHGSSMWGKTQRYNYGDAHILVRVVD